MSPEHPPDFVMRYRAGLRALEAGEDQTALKLLRSALANGLGGPAGIDACVICTGILYEQHNDEEALKFAEHALALDREYLSEEPEELFGLLDSDSSDREELLVRLDNLWSQHADEVESQKGRVAARRYLLSRLKLADHLIDPVLPGVYFRLGEYAQAIGNQEDAKVYLQKVASSQLSGVRDEAVVRQHAMLRAGASIELGKMAEKNEGKGSDCWVATAVYGEESEEVATLRVFRDAVLRRWAVGRVAVALYYFTGPPIARVAGRSTILRGLLRLLIVIPVLVLAKRCRLPHRE